MTPDEIYKELGDSHYIRGDRLRGQVCGTPISPPMSGRELPTWPPPEQGDDVYVRTIEGLRGSTILVILQPT